MMEFNWFLFGFVMGVASTVLMLIIFMGGPPDPEGEY